MSIESDTFCNILSRSDDVSRQSVGKTTRLFICLTMKTAKDINIKKEKRMTILF